jgi:Asp/Glu/hydantoin racemase
MEASLFAARTLGGRFGILATGGRSKYSQEDAVHKYGFDSYCTGVRSCNIGVLDLERKPEEDILRIMCRVAKDLVDEDGADVITLGCAGMSKLEGAVKKAVGEDVQVIDGVLAGVQFLSGLVRMGGRTAKKGIYRSSGITRSKRDQMYV